MELNVRQLEVIFPIAGDLQMVDVFTVYSYVENFGRIVSCEEGRDGLNIRMIGVDGFPLNWANCYHHIDGQQVFLRLEMHFLDLPMFCLKEICKWLLETNIDDFCSATGVCATLKNAATLAFKEKFSKNGKRITLKKQMQADILLLQCLRHSITRLEIHAEDREHFAYILSGLKKMTPNVLKYLIFSNKRPPYWRLRDRRERLHHFSHISKAELEDLLLVFPHLEGLSYNTRNLTFPRLPPNLRVFNINSLFHNERSLELFDTINPNLHKLVISCPNDLSFFEKISQCNQQIKEITIDEFDWKCVGETNQELNDQLEVLSIYGDTISNPSTTYIQSLKKMRNLRILNMSLTNPSIDLMNAINELNVVVECLNIYCPQWNYESFLTIRNFKHLKFLRMERLIPFKELVDVVGHLPQLTVLVLKKHLTSLDIVKNIIRACSKLTDFHVGYPIEIERKERKVDTNQYLEIVSAARSRPNVFQLRIWLTKSFSTNIDSKVYCDNVKYVKVLLKLYKLKSYPPCGFTV